MLFCLDKRIFVIIFYAAITFVIVALKPQETHNKEKNITLSADGNVVVQDAKNTLDTTEQQYSQKFYEEYLAKYYPKALVVRSVFFNDNKPAHVAGALRAFIELLSRKPWFYFVNEPIGFKLTYYWEFVLDQCSLINDYIKQAYVDLEEDKVYFFKYPVYGTADSFGKKRNQASLRLVDYLKNSHNDILGMFYAFSFDYTVKLFNEGILLQNFTKAYRYFTDLEFIIEKLQNTSYEGEYQEFMQIAKNLFVLLKQKQLSNNAAAIDDLCEGGNMSKKYTQASMALKSSF